MTDDLHPEDGLPMARIVDDEPTSGSGSGPWKRVVTTLPAVWLVFVALSSAAADCCSCAVEARRSFANPQLPCLFDHPANWDAIVGDDGALVGAVVSPQHCVGICPAASPGLSVSFAKKSDSNAETMEAIWPLVMPVVGTARCGDATVTFYSPPGSDDTGSIGGVKFYVGIGGAKYSGAATFTCGQPGGWLALRQLFIDTFRGNPGSTFPR
jgi:hypothetical protein